MDTSKLPVGIIGSGIVGQVLAKGFNNEGHKVMLGTRTTSKPELDKIKEDHPEIAIGSFEESARFGEILVLATSGSAIHDAINMAGINNFDGKVVIDATNPIDNRPPDNGVLKFFTTLEDSLMERIQQQIPEAFVVKAFNSAGNALMYKPSFTGGMPTMFICGNNAEAKQTVTALLETFGWATEDMGSVVSARAIEPLCILWCIPGFLRNEWTHAFKLMKM